MAKVAASELGFVIRAGQVRRNILVPKYYDPLIPARLNALARSHDLVPVGALIESGEFQLRQGNYIGKIHYGTGDHPYIRTSDIANWELRGSPKHGVSEDVYDLFASKQDVRELDVLLVHEGTYLIGTPCLLTRHDTKILYQHHLAKLRILNEGRISSPLLMVLLMSPIVQRQIRSIQLTADIIDSIVGRLPEVLLPVPKDESFRNGIIEKALAIFEGRAESRMKLSIFARGLDGVLRAGSPESLDRLASTEVGLQGGIISFLGARTEFNAFRLNSSALKQSILVPRYYDPETDESLRELEATCELQSIGELADRGVIHLETGDEVGKLAYGTGTISFVRTSDLGNWELKHDPKQTVSEEIYEAYASKQSVEIGDILVVRDGTYLVGASALITRNDLPMLFSGGIYRVRVRDRAALDPHLLLALLNTEVVKRQIRDKQFTRDVIDTIGRRFEEVLLPIPKSKAIRDRVADAFKELLQRRAHLLRDASKLGEIAESGVP